MSHPAVQLHPGVDPGDPRVQCQDLILPSVALAVPLSAPLAQVLIRSIDDVTDMPFITVVKARGAGAQWVLWRNVLRNAVLPAITIAGLTFGELVGGAVITEAVFSVPGSAR